MGRMFRGVALDANLTDAELAQAGYELMWVRTEAEASVFSLRTGSDGAADHSRVTLKGVTNADAARASAELQKLGELRAQFITTVSHELRTPLTSIRGYTEILAEDETLPADKRQMVEIIDRNGRRLLQLVDELLEFDRITSGQRPLALRPVDLATLIDDCGAAIAQEVAAAGLRLVRDVHVGLPLVRADRGLLERMLLSLLSNAVRFTPPGGTVTVTGRPVGPDAVLLAVTDTGSGIPLAEQDRLFSRFFRASNAAPNASGSSGIGLAICKAIVDGHGGRIAVESAPGEGKTITVVLAALGSCPAEAA